MKSNRLDRRAACDRPIRRQRDDGDFVIQPGSAYKLRICPIAAPPSSLSNLLFRSQLPVSNVTIGICGQLPEKTAIGEHGSKVSKSSWLMLNRK